jgi:putative transposase
MPATGGRFGPAGRTTEQAAMKCLYLGTRSRDPTGRGNARWAMRWKPALNAFAITFNGRITPTGN